MAAEENSGVQVRIAKAAVIAAQEAASSAVAAFQSLAAAQGARVAQATSRSVSRDPPARSAESGPIRSGVMVPPCLSKPSQVSQWPAWILQLRIWAGGVDPGAESDP